MSAACARCGAEVVGLAACPACLLDAALPVARLGEHLELGEVIGEGGMGTVFAARDLRLERDVAVKLLPPELARGANGAELRARFAREARAMAMLNHPNIVAVHDVGEADGQPYIVMERVEGECLAALLPLPAARVVAIAQEICEALAYAHAHGLVHRDIKPSNVMIGADGRVKVTDFGIARVLDPNQRGWTVTTPEVAVGTPHYMAPEVERGGAADPRMDVYSLGVLIYYGVSGEVPVGNFPPLQGPLDSVVRKALASRPEERYADARAFAAALDEVGGSPGVSGDGATDHRPTAAVRWAPAWALTLAQLPPDQRSWLRGVALVQTLASAIAVWALWLSVTPKVIREEELMPLIMLATERLADGRLVSLARFEIWPSLTAAAAVGVAIVAYGLLRRHWRIAGLEVNAPEQVIPQARLVWICGWLSVGVYAVHMLLLAHWKLLAILMPMFGGLFEMVVLWFFWMAILELWRHGRPLRRAWRLWAGMALAWIPPAADLGLYLLRWTP